MIRAIGVGKTLWRPSRPFYSLSTRPLTFSGFSRVPLGPKSMVFKRGVKTPTSDWRPLTSKTTNIRAAAHQKKMPILRNFFLGLMIAMPVISFCLGCWQVKRLYWKLELIAKCEHLLAQPPLEELPPNIDPAVIPEFEYRRFKIKGTFDYSQEMFLGPRIRNGELGYLVIVPFHRSNGGKPILIERGWILKEKVVIDTRTNGYLAHLALPQGEVEIQAIFRVMPSKSSLHFEHEEGSRLFHVPDVLAMAQQSASLPVYAQALYDLKEHHDQRGPQDMVRSGKSWWRSILRSGNSNDTSYIEEKGVSDATMQYQEFEFINQGVPVGTVPKVTFTNNHVQYLVTWFGLSFFSAGLLIWTILKKGRLLSAEKVLEAKQRDMLKNKF